MQNVLVYNVTHSDLILGVKIEDDLAFARPKFSYVETIGRQVLQLLKSSTKINTTTDEEGRVFKIGFDFEGFSVAWSTLHLRGSASPPLEKEKEAQVVSAFIPLAAQVIPEWMKRIDSDSTKTILLICGAGRPQDRTASMIGNSTRTTAEVICEFMKLHLFQEDHTKIMIIDSVVFDVFDYDENVSFVRECLLPKLEAIRRKFPPNTNWRQHMDVTVALTEGSPARLGALSAALRPYRPWYAQLRQLKTFWHERMILSTDLRFYSFSRIETTPPLVVSMLYEKEYRFAGIELGKYRDEFQTGLENKNELCDFWLRKSNRPVLSVLIVRNICSPSGLISYRGINLEVSQPTGSLCSERNAIGSALAANPQLNRRDVLCVAVLGLPKMSLIKEGATPEKPSSKRVRSESVQMTYALGEGADINPLGPCGACTEWLRKIAEVNPDFKVMTFRDLSCRECFLREVD